MTIKALRLIGYILIGTALATLALWLVGCSAPMPGRHDLTVTQFSIAVAELIVYVVLTSSLH